jgi:two-component system, NarL family, invasion response regulator UvrY
MVKVAIIDDHDLIRYGLVRLLEDCGHIEIIGQGNSGEQAVDIARSQAVDVMLMDVKMPGIGGLEATRKIAKSRPNIKVIAITSCAEDPFPSKLLEAGAAGFLSKGAGTEEIITAINAVMAGGKYLSPEIAQKMALKNFGANDHANPFDELSEREMQITMMIITANKVQVISDALCLSPKTVNTYRYRIFEKLDISSDVELTLLALRYDLIDTAETTM